MVYSLNSWNHCTGLKRAYVSFKKDIYVQRKCMVMPPLMSMR